MLGGKQSLRSFLTEVSGQDTFIAGASMVAVSAVASPSAERGPIRSTSPVGAPTLEQCAQVRDNDYGALAARYREATGAELVEDPYGSALRPGPKLTLTASVVIPAWNARATLEPCLIAIEQSSFNRTYPEQLEVVVVDDGSTDGTAEFLEQVSVGVRLKVVQQQHHSRAHTQNTGIAVAEGDVIISCDADMILAPFAIEELVRRHQVLGSVMLIGFRGDVDPRDPILQPANLIERLPDLLPPYTQDLRLHYRGGGWPESMCRDSDHLRKLGGGRHVFMPDGSQWNLPGIVYGALFSLLRDDLLAMGGYDERFYGWGCEDTLTGVRAIALGNYLIPVYGAAGLHVAHADRSPHKWQEFEANRRVFQAILQAPFTPGDASWTERAKRRIQRHDERSPRSTARGVGRADLAAAFAQALADPDRRGKYLHSLGRFDEAAMAFAEVRGTSEQEAWAQFDRGKALREAGKLVEAADALEYAAARLPCSPWPLIELALTLAAQGKFAPARERLERARGLDRTNPTVAFVLRRSPTSHLERAARYAQQGDYRWAVRDCEAALIVDPRHARAVVERASALAMLSETATAKVTLERARRLQPHDPRLATQLAAIQNAAARVYPLPMARTIVERSQTVPGWLGADEAELLVALAIRVGARGGSGAPPVLVEIGSYCGRATLALALTLRGMGRDDARIISIDEPSLGAAPDGRAPREALRSHLAAHGLADLVVFAPEDEPSPEERISHLVLVDGQHDYASVRGDVERFASRLAPDGFLVFHDYADYFPDVQRYVDELLLAGAYDFVAQASSLIALTRRRGPRPGEDRPASEE